MIATIYALNRKFLIPATKLTHQLTINRSHLFHKIEIKEGSTTWQGISRKPKGILTKIQKSAQFVWNEICDILRLLLRTGHLSILFGPILVVGLPLYLSGALSTRNFVRWIRWSLSRAGATFIKLGQWAATRPDLLPEIFCEELSVLHVKAPSHSMRWNEKVIEAAFGRPLEQVFEEFSVKPIGSGTVAQVHRAKLRNAKSFGHVAVKICHPGIERIINEDLLVLSSLARLVHLLIPPLRWISLPDEVACFSSMMRQQVDLRFEAFTLHRFAQNFEGTSKAWGNLPRILFPRPHFPWVTSKCLVEDLIDDALPIGKVVQFLHESDQQEIIKESQIRKDLAVLGLRGFLQMLLWDNFVHADLHPGNILVTFTENPRGNLPPKTAIGEIADSLKRRIGNLFGSVGKMWQRILTPGELPIDPRDPIKIKRHPGESDKEFFQRQLLNPRGVMTQLVFLDTGLITELSRPDFKNFTDLFQALVLKGDGYLAGELMIDRSPAWARENVRDREGFCRGLAELVRPIFSRRAATMVSSQAASLKELRLDVVFYKLFQLARTHRVRIDDAYTNLVMSLLCVEGLGRQLAPDMDLRPLLAQAALQYLIQMKRG